MGNTQSIQEFIDNAEDLKMKRIKLLEMYEAKRYIVECESGINQEYEKLIIRVLRKASEDKEAEMNLVHFLARTSSSGNDNDRIWEEEVTDLQEHNLKRYEELAQSLMDAFMARQKIMEERIDIEDAIESMLFDDDTKKSDDVKAEESAFDAYLRSARAIEGRFNFRNRKRRSDMTDEELQRKLLNGTFIAENYNVNLVRSDLSELEMNDTYNEFKTVESMELVMASALILCIVGLVLMAMKMLKMNKRIRRLEIMIKNNTEELI